MDSLRNSGSRGIGAFRRMDFDLGVLSVWGGLFWASFWGLRCEDVNKSQQRKKPSRLYRDTWKGVALRAALPRNP